MTGYLRRIGWLTAFSILLLLVAAVVVVLEIIPANAYVILPGEAVPVEPMIKIQGQSISKSSGNLYMTDVSYYKANHLLEQLYGELNPDADIEQVQTFSGGLSQSQYVQYNSDLMVGSIQQAEAAALSAARGYKPHYLQLGPQVVFVLPHTPAAALLRPGDIIKEVNGMPVHTTRSVAPLVRRTTPGGIVHLVVSRNGHILQFAVRTVPSSNGRLDPKGKTALIGIDMQDQVKLKLPIKISISVGNIGGPSAGLMFTLGIIERLQHQDLTHGCKVAGTGTIDVSGKVGEIGGAKQKIIAARNAGARYFLVPDVLDNLNPARAHRGNVTVVPIQTLKQALTFLHGLKPCH